RSSTSHSSSPSGGAAERGTAMSAPRSASAALRSSQPATRTIGFSSVPARRTISVRRPATTTGVPTVSSRLRGRVTWKDPSRPWARPTRPADRSSSSAAAPLDTSVDDVDQDLALPLDRRRLEHGAKGVGGAPALADHAAVVVLGHGQLEDDRAVVLLELLDLDRV